MKAEIERVVGFSRFPCISDRSELPYCEAVVLEVFRCGNVGALSVSHGISQDTVYKGYNIPKEAVVIINLHSIAFDPDLFPEPQNFNPLRFIKDGKLHGHEKLAPFSMGRRMCLGESLARMELFLFLTKLVQRFKFLPEDGDQKPPLDYMMGLTRSPLPYKCCVLVR